MFLKILLSALLWFLHFSVAVAPFYKTSHCFSIICKAYLFYKKPYWVKFFIIESKLSSGGCTENRNYYQISSRIFKYISCLQLKNASTVEFHA